MQKKSILILLFVSLISLQIIKAQTNTYNYVQGNVILDSNATFLARISILLLNGKDSNMYKSTLTDNLGKFSFKNLQNGTYLLHIISNNYEDIYSPIFTIQSNTSLTLPTFKLKSKTNQLNKIEISTKKPLIEIRADKTIYNVEASINATGSNGLELLQKTPGVQVDNNENISLKGKFGTKIYVDGKLVQLDSKNLAEYLKSLQSSDIESIEMIPNPSAKYDASGKGGIINIKLKKNKKYGFNGSVNAGFDRGFNSRTNESINLNYRNKKINIYTNIGGSFGDRRNGLNLNRQQKDTIYDQHSIINNTNQAFYNFKTGIDYFLNANSTLGILATNNIANYNVLINNTTDISSLTTGNFIKQLRAKNDILGNRNNDNYNFNYKYTDTLGNDINFDMDYGVFKGRQSSYQPNNYYDNNNILLSSNIFSNATPTDIDIFTAKIDVEKKIKKGVLGYGAKYSNVQTNNKLDYFINKNNIAQFQADRSNKFDYTENVNALYISYQTPIKNIFNVQAGLRLEQTISRGILTRADNILQADNDIKREYVDLFPSFSISWDLNKKNTLGLSYSKRIDRPNYQDLNPFENKLDELTYEKGNAFLKPQYTDNIELSHTYSNQLTTTVGYSYIKDFATQVTDTVRNSTFVQNQNIASLKMITFNIGYPTQFKKWWSGYVNFWFNYNMFTGKISDKNVSLEFTSLGAYMQQSFILGKDYKAEISGWYNGPQINLGTWEFKSQASIDLGLQKQVLKNKGTLKFSLTDIFRTAPWNATSNFGGLKIKADGYWESHTFKVNFSYRFGNNQVKKVRERKTGLESESKRIKN